MIYTQESKDPSGVVVEVVEKLYRPLFNSLHLKIFIASDEPCFCDIPMVKQGKTMSLSSKLLKASWCLDIGVA